VFISKREFRLRREQVIQLSPPPGFILPSAASEVLLHNGEPLNGPPPAPACFMPMMRQTAVVIDQAGNIWSINTGNPISIST
jgi:hypothetical protein